MANSSVRTYNKNGAELPGWHACLEDSRLSQHGYAALQYIVRQSLVAGTLLSIAVASASAAENTLSVFPARVTLRGPAARQQLVVTHYTAGRPADATRSAKYESQTPNVVHVSSAGLISPVADGEGVVVVRAGGREQRVPVRVRHAAKAPPIDFELDVMPILTRHSCNAGACHGKARGRNGFQLSLLGFDPQFDYDALSKEARGRRVFSPQPERSLLLMKPTGEVPHGGGKRIARDGDEYRVLARWISSGMPRRRAGAPKLVGVTIEPSDRVLKQKSSQQLIVTAKYSDGTTRDVTRLAAYQSNEDGVAKVDETGLITASNIVGDAAVMARYMGHIAVCNIAVPLPGDVPEKLYAELPRHNFIDGHVWNKLARLGITPSAQAPDHKFVRRAYIDVIGRVPTPAEARAFLASKSSNKRSELIEHLLKQPEFADHWANKWADLLRPNAYRVGIKTVLNYDAWIRDSFRQDKPLDQFARELITAQGSTFRNGAVTLFRDRRSPDELTTIVSQLFLGIRLECAKCHHHPFEVWGQDDFYSFAAYFAKIGRKGRGLSPPISGSEEIIFTSTKGTVTHPLTGEVLPPRPLFGKAPEIKPGDDPRVALAAWMTSDKNPYFAKVMVNRVWADLMGRGLVMPVDDLRATNPPSNAELLDALAVDFRENGYNLKHLIRRITNSYVYGLSSLPSKRNVADTRNYSRHYRRRLRAEVLLDSVASITGVPEQFDAMPPGSRAKEVWSHRIPSLFLDAFGRPDPNQDPPCERTGETTVVQALHLMNSENLYRKVTSDNGLAASLAAQKLPPEKIAEELYLAVYSRFPTAEERAIAKSVFEKKGTTPRQAAEDLLWALLNTPEFVFKD